MATAAPLPFSTSNLTVTLASDVLDVREFVVEEGISRLFDVRLVAVSANPDVDFEAAIGAAAQFEIHTRSELTGQTRRWGGVCARLDQTAVEEDGLSTYEIRIVPALWLLTQRKNYRIFQDRSELDIAREVLAEWDIAPRLEVDAASQPKRRYRAQYAETDFDFVSRMLEDAGIAYCFEQSDDGSTMVLVDAPNRRAARAPVPFVSAPNDGLRHTYVTQVQTTRQVRPGRYTQSDVDYRKALDYPLAASASRGGSVESRLERYHHNYGSFLWKAEAGDTPVADDRGAARTDEAKGARQVQKRLEAQRVDARIASFKTTAHDLAPGQVMTITGHPRREVGEPLLVVSATFWGTATGRWEHRCETRYADVDYRPALSTPKPRTLGVESATVTGPAGEEIHTDEFGRIRVHFHWDRQGPADETSSCWIPVSQPWAGAGFGGINLPRVGQEVLVDFLGADPDRPVVLGRVFTKTTPPPYELPKYRMVSGMRSESYPRPKSGGAQARMGGGPPANDLAPPVGGGAPVGRLGGADGGGGAAPDAGAQRILPGAHGAQAAPPAQLDDAVLRMQALGPDEQDTKRSANGVVTDDASGQEKLYLQAQKDMRIAVKDNLVGGVGANRAFRVLGNDFEDIRGYQTTTVAKDRSVAVDGLQNHMVKGDILVDGQSNHVVRTKTDYFSQTVEGSHCFDSKTSTMLKVGRSMIVMLPDAILIDAPKVYINPGPDMMTAVGQGMSAIEAETKAKQAEQFREHGRQMAETMKKMNYTQLRAAEEGNAVARGASTPMQVVARQMGYSTPEQQSQVIWEAGRNLDR